MVANVGAVGGLTCRVSGQEMEATQQSYSLTACQLDPGHGKETWENWQVNLPPPPEVPLSQKKGFHIRPY